MPPATWGIVRSLFFLIPAMLAIVFGAWKGHYSLPTPVNQLHDPATSLPTISETAILEYSRQLSEDIGFRIVGTKEHALADEWIFNRARDMEALCQKVATKARHLECEVWHQSGSSAHRFDMMGKRLYKVYEGLTNVVVRLSNGTEEGKQHAVLVNAHLDSTLPSPGAADDALAVGVMLECIRVLIEDPSWEPSHAVIFLFNHAEESLQDASHLYSTQHPTAKTVRAVINLEAAGTTGPTLLFQATSEEMILAYSHVPHPYGNVVANEIFSSGIVLSDTDFRQFELYLNVTGLDMAVVGHSYFYHTRKDLVKYIEAGVAQHMADNALVLLKHLSSSVSPIARIDTNAAAGGTSTIYFSVMGKYFIMYSRAVAAALSVSAFAASLAVFKAISPTITLRSILYAQLIIFLAAVCAMVGANATAFVMDKVLSRPLAWFSAEMYPILLFGPPALAGSLLPRLLFSMPDERLLLGSTLLLQTSIALIGTIGFGLGSSQLFLIVSASELLGLLFAYLTSPPKGPIKLSSYLIWQILPLSLSVDLGTGTLDFFVPLSGRIGGDAPVDHIIATIVSFVGVYAFPAVPAFFSRFPRKVAKNSLLLLCVVTVINMTLFCMKTPFDAMHPKRVFVLHTENVTSGESHIHVSAADRAPHFGQLVGEMAHTLKTLGHVDIEEPFNVDVTAKPERNGDWDILYPFSAFLTPYRLPLTSTLNASRLPEPKLEEFRIKVLREVEDLSSKTRRLDLEIQHPGLIWSVISFDAQVLSWTLDDNPPEEYSRHYIKEASFYGISSYNISLTIRITQDSHEKLTFNYVAIREDTMYPAKAKAPNAATSEVMRVLRNLDDYLENEYKGSLDLVFLSCIAGVVII